MIAFLGYLFVILILIRFTVQKLIPPIKPSFFLLLVFAKCMAVPAFYFLYQQFPGGFEKSDSGKFYSDILSIRELAHSDFSSFLRLMSGFALQQDQSAELQHCLTRMNQWSNGAANVLPYNDNRVLIRIHALLSFLPFANWYVHALFCCLFSLAGIILLHRAFSIHFAGKENLFFVIAFFFPSLWLYTGGLLKEGICVFFLGSTAVCLRRSLHHELSAGLILSLCCLALLSILVKPYLLAFGFVCFALYFLYNRRLQGRKLLFTATLAAAGFFINFFITQLGGQSIEKAALHLRHSYTGVEKGGIYLSDGFHFVRLDYNLKSVHQGQDGRYRIGKGIPFHYWEDTHHLDTLYQCANQDTTHAYDLVDSSPAGNSNFSRKFPTGAMPLQVIESFYRSLFYPFFFNANSRSEWVASFENLIIALALLMVLFNMAGRTKNGFLPYVFVIFAVGVSFFSGFVVSNTGTIIRYRAPAILFLLLAALYFYRYSPKKYI
jgi:hypothetical protein